MSVCRVISWVVGKGCLLWPARSLDKSLLAFSLLHFVLLCQPACYSRYFLTYYFCNPIPYDEKDIFILVLVLEGLLGLHRTSQLQLLRHQWLGQRLGLLWYWMVCIGNEPRSFCCFWDYTQALHFRLLLIMRATPFLLRIWWGIIIWDPMASAFNSCQVISYWIGSKGHIVFWYIFICVLDVCVCVCVCVCALFTP